MRQERGKSQFKIVRKEGGSRVLTVTDFIPPDWRMVLVEVIDKESQPLSGEIICISVDIHKIA